MSNNHTVTTCLLSFANENGFVDIQLQNNHYDHHNVSSAAKKYFSPEVHLEEARITFLSGGQPEDEPYDMVILYDQDLHGTKTCPYLAFKVINKDRMTSIGREHYMDLMKVVEL